MQSLGLAEEGAPPRIEAWNKIDLLSGEERERARSKKRARREDVVPISAVTGEGLDELRERMAEKLRSGEQVHQIRLAGERRRARSPGCIRAAKCSNRSSTMTKLELSVRLSPDNWARFQAMESA